MFVWHHGILTEIWKAIVAINADTSNGLVHTKAHAAPSFFFAQIIHLGNSCLGMHYL